MDWKDTVMNNEEIKTILLHAYQLFSEGKEYKFTMSQVERIIEISFEAGRKDEREDTVIDVLDYFCNYVRQLERKYPNPDIETQGWLGTIWDMIRCARKEDWQALKEGKV